MHTILYSNTEHSETYTKFKEERQRQLFHLFCHCYSKKVKVAFLAKKEFSRKVCLEFETPCHPLFGAACEKLRWIACKRHKTSGLHPKLHFDEIFFRLSIFLQKSNIHYLGLKMTKIVTTFRRCYTLRTYFFENYPMEVSFASLALAVKGNTQLIFLRATLLVVLQLLKKTLDRSRFFNYINVIIC